MITSDIPSQPWKHVSTDTLPRYHSTLLMGTTPHGVRHSLEIYIPIFFNCYTSDNIQVVKSAWMFIRGQMDEGER